MAYQRSEYEDSSLKKNAFSGRLLKLQLEKLDSEKDQVSKQFKQEKDELRRQLAEGEQIVKSKLLDPENIRPLSSVDLKKLSPKFARKLSASPRLAVASCALPQIATAESSKPLMASAQLLQAPRENSGTRRFSLPPTITFHECLEHECGKGNQTKLNNNIGKLLMRRRSSNSQDMEDVSKRINEFLGKLKKNSDDEDPDEGERKK